MVLGFLIYKKMLNTHVIENLFRYKRTKDYWKKTWFNKVIAKTKWCKFLGTQCIFNGVSVIFIAPKVVPHFKPPFSVLHIKRHPLPVVQ